MSFAGQASSSILSERGRSVVHHRARATRAYGRYQPSPKDFLGSFPAVLERWEDETAFLSDPQAITSHPSYRALVENALVAVPLILRELQKGPSPLVWVLEDAFPGERPYSDDKIGNLVEMTKAWLAWGERRGRNL
jgi:hypothetical protein